MFSDTKASLSGTQNKMTAALLVMSEPVDTETLDIFL